ncbi:hypothetical protein PPERSA_06900 [Pseudocohnilembus persalinus]|uniref:EF-hand domain-containing protein n=1 Tax=Pseudocohnilembus persalinus TaxID=266149 RepID=A0A0V0QZF9_PSEPJ|nr:hypothetical protein PPERSA_06900 [Pseudocohnilembus persalinus]|eukprot:KRX07285.1 hypothetical protein PPERSA_06900 [Pseudocohnilembus persalinus]
MDNRQGNNYQGITDLEGAKAVARRIFEQYDKEKKGEINTTDTIPMIVEAYRSFNFQFSPQTQDINAYYKILDRNGDGRITYDDIEQTCIRYLCPSAQLTPQGTQYQEQQKQQKRISQQAQRHLDVAERLFARFDKDNSGYLDTQEVRHLLAATYQEMGMPNFTPSDDDVTVWIRMTDTNNDGRISLEEYKTVVMNSLRRAGFQVEELDGPQY